jgi:hypothetical protein
VKTAFSAKRMEFTKRAHLAAEEQFYAPMFPGRQIAFEDTVGTVRDLEYAIDCQLAVTVPDLRAPIRFAVQERWREPAAMRYGDVTITEWNSASNLPSELHKFGAHLFVYGFYDQQLDQIMLGVAVDIPVLLRELALGRLKYRRESRLDQTFLAFDVRGLRSCGAVVFEHDCRVRCVTCDVAQDRWDTRSRFYSEGAAQCPACADADACDWPEPRRPPDYSGEVT